MKIDLRNYQIGKLYRVEDDIDFSNHNFAHNYRIRKIKSCHIKMEITVFDYVTDMKINLVGEVIGACSYTNEDVNVKYKTTERLSFSNDPDSAADYYEPKDVFDLDPYILALIDNAVPLNIVKEGAKLPESGKGYEVVSEEDYLKSKKEKKDSRWDALDQLEFDD